MSGLLSWISNGLALAIATIAVIIVIAAVIYLLGRKRRDKLRNLLHLRKQRSKDDAQR
jgi:predicted PurR-regulated permease PerM